MEIIEGIGMEDGEVILCSKIRVKIELDNGPKIITLYLAAGKDAKMSETPTGCCFTLKDKVYHANPEHPEYVDYVIDPIEVARIPMITFSMFEIVGAAAYGKVPEIITRRLLEAGAIIKKEELSDTATVHDEV